MPPTASAAVPQRGVSLRLLAALRDDPRMLQPMCELLRPGVVPESLSPAELRALAAEMRAHSNLDRDAEIARYQDERMPREVWFAVVRSPPTTTAHVCACIVQPDTARAGCSYAEMLER
eukprot:5964375-Prymnesium_polylepis.2